MYWIWIYTTVIQLDDVKKIIIIIFSVMPSQLYNSYISVYWINIYNKKKWCKHIICAIYSQWD